jgi:SdrD B-like protein
VVRKHVVLAVAGLLVMSGSAAAVPPANQVSGVVWLDSNKNGVRDGGEPGVPGIAVVLRDGTGQQVGSATTEANGKYAVAAPSSGFTVCFGLSGAYADYVFTTPELGTGCVAGTPIVDAGIASPPNKLGGAVWFDANRNGLQDSGEPWIPGVTVVVKDGKGNQIGAATTDAGGRYHVDNLPDGTFTVCFGMSTLPDSHADNLVTKPNAGDDLVDSDADQTTGCSTPVNLGPDNRENLTVDAGTVAPTNRLGDYVWIDGNRNGVQDLGEPGALGVTVVLQTGGVEVARTTTNANGRYLFATMPDGIYRVCFELGALPAAVANYTVTQANAGGDTTIDSDADATGCTPATTLGVGRRANFGLDAGLVAVPN